MRRKHLHDAPYNGAGSPRKAAGEGVHSYGELFCKVASTGSDSLATRTHGRPCVLDCVDLLRLKYTEISYEMLMGVLIAKATVLCSTAKKIDR